MHAVYPQPILRAIPWLQVLYTGTIDLVLTLLLAILNGIYLSNILFKYAMIQQRSHLPTLFYVLLVMPSLFKASGLFYFMLSATVLLIIIDLLFQEQKNDKLNYRYFDAVLLLSVASFFNASLILVLPFIIAINLRLRAPRIKEMLLILLGLLTPYFILFSTLFLAGIELKAFISHYSPLYTISSQFDLDKNLLVLMGVIAFNIFVSSIFSLGVFTKVKVITRKLYGLFLFLFVLTIALALVVSSVSIEAMFLTAVPASFIMALYYQNCRPNIWNRLLFGISLLVFLGFEFIP